MVVEVVVVMERGEVVKVVSSEKLHVRVLDMDDPEGEGVKELVDEVRGYRYVLNLDELEE